MELDQLTFGLDWESEASQSRPSHPGVWVKELAVYAEWKPEALLRRISLRKGLNVLWAEPGERGLSGHAAGKTVFCRLVRYLLGDGNWGKARFRDAFRLKFPKAWLVGEVHIGETPWLVARYLGVGTQRHWAAEGLRFYSEAEEIEKVSYAEFHRKLEKAILGPVPSTQLSEEGKAFTWHHLLAWLTRDQESRYADLAEWRSPLSESESPSELSKLDRYHLVRTVLGLLSVDEQKAMQQHMQLLSRQRQLRDEIPKLQYAAQRDRERFVSGAGMEKKDEFPGEFFLQQGVQVMDQLRSECDPLSASIVERETELQSCERELAELRARKQTLAEQKHSRSFLQQRCRLQLDRINSRISQEDFRAQMDGKTVSPDPCSLSYEDAKAIGCPLAWDPDGNIESERDWHAVATSLRALLERVSNELEAYERENEALTEKEAALVESIEARKCECHAQRDRLQDEEHRLDRLSILHRNVRNAVEELESLSAERDRLESDVVKSQEHLRHIRAKATRAGSAFSAAFQDIIKHVLTDEAEARVDLRGRDLEPEIVYKGDLSSAAMETVKILAFDIAALAFSAAGHGHHPRFLMHDSPREADLAAHIYRRFFQYALALEERLGEANFQYIMTTTESPPKVVEMRGALLEPVLDASRPEGRLLGADL